MLQNITLGQFFPGNSILHRLDPRTKIILLFALIIAIFAAQGWAAYALLSGVTACLILMSHVPPLTVLKSVKPLGWIILFTLLIHFVSHDGEVLAKVYVFKVTTEGIVYGLQISLRLVLLIMLSSLLTFTTSPLQLTDATEKLLSPFAKVGLPAHELAMMMTIAIRFVQDNQGATFARVGLRFGRARQANAGDGSDIGAAVPVEFQAGGRFGDGNGGALLSRRRRTHAHEKVALDGKRLRGGFGRDCNLRGGRRFNLCDRKINRR